MPSTIEIGWATLIAAFVAAAGSVISLILNAFDNLNLERLRSNLSHQQEIIQEKRQFISIPSPILAKVLMLSKLKNFSYEDKSWIRIFSRCSWHNSCFCITNEVSILINKPL